MRGTPRSQYVKWLLLAAGWWLSLPAVGAQIQADLLVYRVQSPGGEIDINRFLVTPDYLRLDRGAQDSGYILFDRRQQVIYSVNHEDQSILVIDPPPLQADPAVPVPEISLQAEAPGEVPAVGGVAPQRWRLSASGKRCRQAFILPGLMPQAVAAYVQYLDVLARQQAVALTTLPAEFRDDCDSAIHVFAPTALLHKGLILKAWDDQGYLEELVDFRPGFAIPDSDLVLPEDYRQVPMTPGL